MSLRRNQNKGKESGNRGRRSKKNKGIKRVADIILDSSHPAYTSRDSLGIVFFTDEKTNEVSQNPITLPFALPSNRGNVTYPDIGDLVRIESGPSGDYYPDIGGSKKIQALYYTGPISVHNNTSNNALPLIPGGDTNLGRVVNENIKPLNPSPGDTVMEGKNGQRIRFTSVGAEGSNAVSIGATEDPNDGNPTIGSKAIIISLGEGTTENITNDAASIVLLENSSLPIDAASTNIDSLKSNYTEVQTPMEELENGVPDAPESPTVDSLTEEEEVILDFSNPDQTTVEDQAPGGSTIIEDDPFDDPVFNALDEALEEGILNLVTPEKYEFDDEYIVAEGIPFYEIGANFEIDTINIIEGEDSAFAINPNKFGAFNPGVSYSRGPLTAATHCPAFKEFGFTF